MRRATRAGPMGAPWVYYIYIYVYWLLPIACSIYILGVYHCIYISLYIYQGNRQGNIIAL